MAVWVVIPRVMTLVLGESFNMSLNKLYSFLWNFVCWRVFPPLVTMRQPFRRSLCLQCTTQTTIRYRENRQECSLAHTFQYCTIRDIEHTCKLSTALLILCIFSFRVYCFNTATQVGVLEIKMPVFQNPSKSVFLLSSGTHSKQRLAQLHDDLVDHLGGTCVQT